MLWNTEKMQWNVIQPCVQRDHAIKKIKWTSKLETETQISIDIANEEIASKHRRGLWDRVRLLLSPLGNEKENARK